jgi:lipopolysaccharide/colanic/teichoic acid biosynthesis glycosyltransferase
LLAEYLPLYSKDQRRRHDVLPGITGWAQINGRNNVSWEDKFKMDTWYVDNKCMLLDLKIFFMTFLVVICRRGISSPGSVTAKPFIGIQNASENNFS